MSSGKLMNAVRFHGQEDLRFEQIPEPECGKGQVKIKPAWCGICGRDRVVVQPIIYDGTCGSCEEGLVNCCDNNGFVGLSGKLVLLQ